MNPLPELTAVAFHLYVWPQRLLVTGPVHASGEHRHHAAQIACGLHGPVAYRSRREGEVCSDLLLIPPDVRHSHDAFGAAAVLYLDAQSREWNNFEARGSTGLSALPFDARLRALAGVAARGDANAARQFADALSGSTDDAAEDDPLVSQVRELVLQRLDGKVTLAGLAATVHRSPSRLAHRFRQATGVPLRRYVLWRRLRAAVEAAMRGANLTDAAHAAGFADSAHLSRTFRANFGIAPSTLFERGRLAVTFF